MKVVLHSLISFFIFFPMVVFAVTFYFCRKRKMPSVKAFGLASDQTTIWLFFSVPLAISSLWGIEVGGYVVIIALVIAMIFTYIEWKMKKEIEMKPLLKKVWRVFFLLLTIGYLVVWTVGLLHSIIKYVLMV